MLEISFEMIARLKAIVESVPIVTQGESGRAVQRCVLGMVRTDAQQALPEVRRMAKSKIPAAANV